MSGYQVALFVHLVALFAAFGASTVVHLAMVKVRSARNGGEALPWLGAAHAFARAFPLALAALVGSGAWMVHSTWGWSNGFVEAGLAGAALLFVMGGAVEAGRARTVAAALAAQPAAPVPAIVRDLVWWCVSWGNTGTALGVVLAMVAKPSTAAAFGIVVAGLVTGSLVGLAARRGAVPNAYETT